MWVVVLNDGETYTALEGCSILWIPTSEQWGREDQYVKNNVEAKGVKLGVTDGKADLFDGDIILTERESMEIDTTTDVDMEENRYILCPACQASVLPEQTIADGCGFCKD